MLEKYCHASIDLDVNVNVNYRRWPCRRDCPTGRSRAQAAACGWHLGGSQLYQRKISAQLHQTALGMEEVVNIDWMLPIFGKGMFRGEALGRYVKQVVAVYISSQPEGNPAGDTLPIFPSSAKVSTRTNARTPLWQSRRRSPA